MMLVELLLFAISQIAVLVCLARWWRYSRASMDLDLPDALHEASTRLRARWQRRLWAALGCWQIMVGVFLTRAPDNGWESGIALYLCGGFFLVLAWEPWRMGLRNKGGHAHTT